MRMLSKDWLRRMQNEMGTSPYAAQQHMLQHKFNVPAYFKTCTIQRHLSRTRTRRKSQNIAESTLRISTRKVPIKNPKLARTTMQIHRNRISTSI